MQHANFLKIFIFRDRREKNKNLIGDVIVESSGRSLLATRKFQFATKNLKEFFIF